MADRTPYVMTSLEVARGVVLGDVDPGPSQELPASHPRTVLEDLVRERLERPPCGVAFSGGRDSSLVLAVALHVARREGLPEPIAITKVFPDAPDTDESEWQEMVIRHLEVTEWHRLELRDELELIGPLAGRHLRTHGVLWPPVVHGDVPIYRALGGGSVLDGEGGDEVLGVETHRVAPLASLVRSRGRRSRRGALRVIAPRRARERYLRTHWNSVELPWLRDDTRMQFVEELVSAEARRPLSFSRSVAREPLRRSRILAGRNRQVITEEFGVDAVSPLLDPAFVNSLGRAGGRLGPGDRNATLSDLAADLLPDRALRRSTKASFADAYWGERAAEFAMRWTGGGVDSDLVEPEALRHLWRAGVANAMTSALLQTAWLAADG